MAQRKTTIYLSSTYEDLKDHRRAVIEALRTAGHDVCNMEIYGARSQRPLDACLEDVAEADLYVGLFAFRYGFVPDNNDGLNPDGCSITELELRKAQRCGKPVLVFLADDAALVVIAMTTLKMVSADSGYSRWVRLVGGLVMLALGAILIAKPQWLAFA